MPYIKNEDRLDFNPYLFEAIEIILKESCNFKKAEMIGWWAYYLTHKQLPGFIENIDLKSSLKELKKQADYIFSLPIMTNSTSEEKMFSLAGNLNYCISYVTWGVLDDYPDVKSASYGMRCYTSQKIRQIIGSEYLNLKNDSLARERLFSIVKGVLFDVLEELYRRKTAIYEDKKIIENGDLYFFKQS